MIIVQKRRSKHGFLVPAGGELLWYGVASGIPDGWEVVTYAANCFVMGADQNGAGDTPVGAADHSHSNPAATGAVGDHAHGITGVVGNASGSTGFYGTANSYTAPAGHGHGDGTGTSGAAGGHTHALTSTKLATVYPHYKRLYWIRATRDGTFPIGGIMIWDNAASGLPEGFYLCDGQTHDSLVTPDLRDEFIYGAAQDADVGLSGGAETHRHGNYGTEAAGGHTHGMSVSVGGSSSSKNASGYEGTRVASGGHGHGLSATSNTDDSHTHTVGDTDLASNLPPYLMLYFAMRTGG